MALGMRTLWNKIKTVLVRELHANTSPMRASLSLAFGILVGFSPFYGIHTLIVLPLAFLFRLNRPLALLATSATILPFVPFWLAAGIFTGELVVPVETAGAIIDFVRDALPSGLFDRMIENSVEFSKHILPTAIFDKIDAEAGHGVIDGFVQWMIGTCVLAVIGAVVTFVVSYLLLLRREVARRKRQNMQKCGMVS
jgi:uncharacterized protein (DUF2062 family)